MNADIVSLARLYLRTELLLQEEDLDDVLAIAATSLSGSLDDIRQALDAGDAPKIAFAAHTLKGNLRNLGLADASEQARLIEAAARQEGLADLAPQTEALAGLLSPLLTR